MEEVKFRRVDRSLIHLTINEKFQIPDLLPARLPPGHAIFPR